MLSEWSLKPKLIIQYYEQAGFPKLTKWQKFKVYLFCYWTNFKTFLRWEK